MQIRQLVLSAIGLWAVGLGALGSEVAEEAYLERRDVDLEPGLISREQLWDDIGDLSAREEPIDIADLSTRELLEALKDTFARDADDLDEVSTRDEPADLSDLSTRDLLEALKDTLQAREEPVVDLADISTRELIQELRAREADSQLESLE